MTQEEEATGTFYWDPIKQVHLSDPLDLTDDSWL